MEEKVIYEKKSNQRAEEFALETYIYETNHQEKYVVKKATYSEGNLHVLEMQQHFTDLSALFRDSGIRVLSCKVRGDEVTFPYVEGETLEDSVNRLVEQGSIQEAKTLIAGYLETIRRVHSQKEFCVTEEFDRVFGSFLWDKKYMAADVNDIDAVLDNVMVADGERYLIDYEWTFHFPVPVDFILFRILHYFIFRNANCQQLIDQDFLSLVDYSREEIGRFLEMEENFQRYMRGSVLGEWDDISPEEMQRLYDINFGKVYLDFGRGYNERQVQSLDMSIKDGFHQETIEIPKGVLSCRIDPLEGAYCKVYGMRLWDDSGRDITDKLKSNGIFLGDEWYFLDTTDPYFEIDKPCNRIQLTYGLTRIEGEVPEKLLKQYQAKQKQKKIKNAMVRLGHNGGRKQDLAKSFRDINYQVWFDRNKIQGEAIDRQKEQEKELAYRPKISIVVLDADTPYQQVTEMMQSILAQTYSQWELFFFTEKKRDRGTKMLQRTFAREDSRISVCRKEGDASGYDLAKKWATGEYVAMVDVAAVLEPDALFEIAKELQQKKWDLLYTDEDCITEDILDYVAPRIKPDYSPDLLRSYNYMGNLLVINRQILEQLDDCESAYDYTLRCTEKAESIRHLPRVLYHGRFHPSQERDQSQVIEAHLQRVGDGGKVYKVEQEEYYHTVYPVEGKPLVSVIIPNKDHVEVLERCVRSLFEVNTYSNIEVIIVENNSQCPETFSYYEKLQARYDKVKVITWEHPFNFSAINNYGEKFAGGEYLLLLNNDTEMITPEGIADMLGNCLRSNVGAVGAKLLYEDGTVQHGGVILGLGGYAGHIFHGFARDAKGYMNRLAVNGNYSAVTAACLMTKKDLFEGVGGLTEAYTVAVNDVDYCLKLRERGYFIVYDAFAEWYHYESKTRGYENDSSKVERFRQEVALFNKRWGNLRRQGDPYYSENFQQKAPFVLK